MASFEVLRIGVGLPTHRIVLVRTDYLKVAVVLFTQVFAFLLFFLSLGRCV